VSTPKQRISVTRDYRPGSDYCARALVLLLRKSISQKEIDTKLVHNERRQHGLTDLTTTKDPTTRRAR
jgi:hypothetical protein